MKTATIRVYLMFATRNEYCAEVIYRGKLLYSLFGDHPGDMLKTCRYFAHQSGFTHTKTTLG